MSGRRAWTLTLVRGGGRATESVRLPVWVPFLPLLCFVGGFAASVWSGWLLHGSVGLAGHIVQAALPATAHGHWAGFVQPGAEREAPTMRELERRRARARAGRLELGTFQTAGQLLAGLVDARWTASARARHAPTETLLWPVTNGWYVRGYGSGAGSYHLAVDVAGERGSAVRAAAPGLVGYADDTVRGFGKMVILIHPQGWVTVYAHNRKNYVVAGEYVEAGETLAELGTTGISRGPHVHFELIHHGRNCDPVPLFRPGVRHRSGRESHVSQATWSGGPDRPSAIRCDRRRQHPHSRWHDSQHAEAGPPETGTPQEELL